MTNSYVADALIAIMYLSEVIPFGRSYQTIICRINRVLLALIGLLAVVQIQAAETGFAPGDCNDPMVEKGIVIDDIAGSCLLCGNGDLEDLIDGDLSNFTTFTAPLTVLAPVQVVSIRDVEKDYTSGNRVGYVIEPVGGILDATVLGGFQIRTFKDGVLKETVTGAALTVHEQGDLRRVSFVTSQSYDEVELRLVTTLGLLTSVRVYYAYGEPANGCNYACINALVPPNYSSEINDPPTGIFGICLFCELNNEDNVVDADTTNFAHIKLPVGVGGNAVIAVDINENVPANYDVGFAVRQGAGLLNLTLLGAITITTYKGGMMKESVVATNALVDVTLLGNTNINLIRFKATQEFDEVRIKVSGISLLVDMDVFFAFVRPDDDNDGFTNCVDRCAGDPDYLDADGDATPDACDDPVCTVNAGLDLSACPPAGTAQLVAAGPGQTWSALSGNPAPATVSNAGAVAGMSVEGVYGFVLTEGTCKDTVYISRYESTLDAACNNPITGPMVIVTDPGNQDCLLCADAEVFLDGSLSNSVSLNVSTSILGATTLLAVKDTSQVYPAGRKTGFVVAAEGGLLNATLLSNFQIKTYLNGVLQETATVGGGLLTAGALAGDEALQRLSFVTTQPFNEVELVVTATLNLLTAFRVYYAFEEPGSGCPDLGGNICQSTLTAQNATFCGDISYPRTGITGVVCVACGTSNLGNVIDEDPDSYATIQLTVGIGASGKIAVKTRQTVSAGHTAGFVISGPANLLDLGVLGGLWVRTFLNGMQKEAFLASGGLLQVQVLDADAGVGQISFVTTQNFDEIQLQVDGLITALGTVHVHYGFVRQDTDGDGSPDCADKCCSGSDQLDTNGNGVPDACDPLPVVVNDSATTPEDTQVTANVTANDDFGADGPSSAPIQLVGTPDHGTASVNDSGTPTDPTDDVILYTPNANFTGNDTVYYRICDSSNDCDTGFVAITVNAVNDPPVAANKTAYANKDIPVEVCQSISDPDHSSFATTLVCSPANGTVSGLSNPSTSEYCMTYTPDAGFSGNDTLCVSVCDGDGLCDTSYVFLYVSATSCNDPMVEKGVVVDDLDGLCLLCGNGDLENLIDGDLSNYTTFTAPVTLLAPTPVVSIKDVAKVYDAGDRVGYVIEPLGGLLDDIILSGFQVRTFKNNVLQESVTGTALTVHTQDKLRRLSFITTKDYDEVELRLVSTLGVLTSVRVYYAYGEPALGCDYNCATALAPPSYSSSINDPATGIFGICLLCSLTDEGNVVDGDTTNFAEINLPIGVAGSGVIAVEANETIPAHYEAGFAVRQGVGLLDLNLLGGITLSTYAGGVLQESVVANSALASVALLAGTDINLISFKTTQDFDEIRISAQGLVSLLVDLDVFYAFVRPDEDNDGFVDCVDRCPNEPDYLDEDGDGSPDDCDPACNVNAGLDLSACPPATTAQLPAAAMGQTWSALPGNPASASVDNTGAVTGMSAEGVYGFVLTEGSCTDTVYISRFESTLDASCNNPITGPKVIVTDPGGPDCLLCVGADVVVDGVLTGSVSLNVSLPILSATTLIAVKDTSQVYPAGRRTGFVVQVEGGLLNATLLGNLEIRTYLNGTLQETATVSGNVLTANALTGDGALQRLSFVTTLPFNEVELVATSTLNLLTAFRVFYAFEEPGTGCPNSGEECVEALTINDMTYCGQISYEHTGITGLACVDCGLESLGHLVDANTGNYATIQLTAGVGAAGQVAVYTRQTITAGYTAGFIISGPPNLLDATVLGGIRVTTFLNGVQQESELGTGGLLQAQVISATSGRSLVSFVTTQAFDEIQLEVEGLVSALGTVYVYNAFVRRDSDSDGAPDCADKCCSGNDLMDANGDGVPDACDPLPVALDDAETTNEDTPVDVLVLANDDFGANGAGNPSLEIVTTPANGTAVVNNNGTPGILTDDYIVYSPAANFTGSDMFTYRICDASNDCDTATVVITINPLNDPPVSPDTTGTTPEDTPVVICSDINDVDNNSFTTTLLCDPEHGTVSGLTNPSTAQYCLTYTPDPNFNGMDSVCVKICDADGACDTSYITITVTPVPDPPVALNNTVSTLESQPVNIPVLNNDTDPDGNLDTSSVTLIIPPVHGTATPNPTTGVIEYVPNNNFFGEDTLKYAVCDQDMQCDTALVFIMVNANKVRLSLKMQLQGSLYDSPDSLMRDELRAENKLPVLEPYTALTPSFVHVNGGGGELVANTAAVFADLGANSIVDWVFVELRDSANLGQVVATRAALLQRDGDVVDVDGTSVLTFQSSVPAAYAVAIRHRNHLGCMTATALSLSGEGTVVDFTNTSISLWDDGTNLNGLEQKTINGKFALWAGNVNKNNSVVFAGQNNDKDPIFNQVDQAPGNIFKSQTYIYNGYHLGDVNMDGSAIFAGQRNDVDPIFNNVDSHPKNILKSQTFIIRQQLAQ